MKGTVKFYNRKQQFGFVIGSDGKEYYLHAAALVPLKEKSEVSFIPATSKKGLEAQQVQRVCPGSRVKTVAYVCVALILGVALGHFL